MEIFERFMYSVLLNQAKKLVILNYELIFRLTDYFMSNI